MIDVRVTNVVATGNLGQKVDLKRCAPLKYALFNLAIYHCAYVKTPKMHSKVSVFHTGKMISIGTRSGGHARDDLWETANYLADEGLVAKTDPGMKLRNIVLNGDFGRSLDITNIHTSIGPSIYEPEQFPGLIHHPPQYPGVAILLFQSGKFVVAGLKRFQEVKNIRLYLNTIEKRLGASH